jgi:hypothetical protein
MSELATCASQSRAARSATTKSPSKSAAHKRACASAIGFRWSGVSAVRRASASRTPSTGAPVPASDMARYS